MKKFIIVSSKSARIEYGWRATTELVRLTSEDAT